MSEGQVHPSSCSINNNFHPLPPPSLNLTAAMAVSSLQDQVGSLPARVTTVFFSELHPAPCSLRGPRKAPVLPHRIGEGLKGIRDSGRERRTFCYL